LDADDSSPEESQFINLFAQSEDSEEESGPSFLPLLCPSDLRTKIFPGIQKMKN